MTGARAAAPTAAPLVVVSGLPRSGTSLLMQMLEAGGLPALTDHVRKADQDNPRGYLEWEPVRRIAETPAALDAARGKALKVISALLPALPLGHRYRVLFMERDLREVHASQSSMLARRGETTDGATPDDLARHVDQIRSWLRRQSHMETCFVSHRDAIERPAVVARRVREFLGLDLDLEPMAAAADPALHRHKAGGLRSEA